MKQFRSGSIVDGSRITGRVWRRIGSFAKYALRIYVIVLVLKEDLKFPALSSAIPVHYYITLPVEPLVHPLTNQNP